MGHLVQTSLPVLSLLHKPSISQTTRHSIKSVCTCTDVCWHQWLCHTRSWIPETGWHWLLQPGRGRTNSGGPWGRMKTGCWRRDTPDDHYTHSRALFMETRCPRNRTHCIWYPFLQYVDKIHQSCHVFCLSNLRWRKWFNIFSFFSYFIKELTCLNTFCIRMITVTNNVFMHGVYWYRYFGDKLYTFNLPLQQMQIKNKAK